MIVSIEQKGMVIGTLVYYQKMRNFVDASFYIIVDRYTILHILMIEQKGMTFDHNLC